MANEITIDAGLQISNGTIDNKIVKRSLKFDQTGKHGDRRTVSIGTSDEQLAIGADVGTNGWAWMRNHDTTNFVDVGVRTATGGYLPMLKMKAGEPAVCRFATGIAIYARADTAAVDLEYMVAEE